MGRRRGRRRPVLKFAREPDQILAHPQVKSFETPAFGRSQIFGKGQATELDEGLGNVLKAMFEISDSR